MTFVDTRQLDLSADGGEIALGMDEEAFRAFYDRTSRVLWIYLWRITGDRQASDDLLQEAYYRLLRARTSYQGDAHRRNALFHIATNLARDLRRRRMVRAITEPFAAVDLSSVPDPRHLEADADDRTDLARGMAHLSPRERSLVWLAYAQGLSHREIGDALGVKTESVKLMLFRARRKLAVWLTGRRGGAA